MKEGRRIKKNRLRSHESLSRLFRVNYVDDHDTPPLKNCQLCVSAWLVGTVNEWAYPQELPLYSLKSGAQCGKDMGGRVKREGALRELSFQLCWGALVGSVKRSG